MNRDKLILSAMDCIVWQARKYTPCAHMQEELVQEGLWGACLAADTFDESRGFKFMSHASIYIKDAMIKFMQKNYSIVVMPRGNNKSSGGKSLFYCIKDLPANPTDADKSAFCKVNKITPQKLDNYLATKRVEGDAAAYGLAEDGRQEFTTIMEDLTTKVKEVLAALPIQYRDVILAVHTEEPITNVEYAKQHNMTKSNVGYLYRKGMTLMREQLQQRGIL